MSILNKILQELPFNRRELARLIATAPIRYKFHLIKKRKGGVRQIAQPTAEVKLLQRWVLKEIISKLPLHDVAIAYRKGGATKNHAAQHASNKYLLKLDFKDFFPSITATCFASHLEIQQPELTKEDIDILCNILFHRDKLSQKLCLSIGAPSSPAVSNAVIYFFDQAVADFCKDLDVRYTRYADDMAFSTNKPKTLDEVHKFISDFCGQSSDPRLRLNTTKTVNVSKKFHRELTGLILTNDGRLSLGHKKRRQIRAMIDYFARGMLSPKEIAHLQGLIAYARSIDPSILNLLDKRLSLDQKAVILQKAS